MASQIAGNRICVQREGTRPLWDELVSAPSASVRSCIMFNLVGTFKAFTCQDGAGDVGSCSGSDPAISLSIASTYIVYAFTYRLVALHPGWA